MRILKRNGLKLAMGLSKSLSFTTLSLMAVLAVEFWILTGKEYSEPLLRQINKAMEWIFIFTIFPLKIDY